jgi:unsaturated rhamnogalacturonyl hydrolase
MPYPYFFGKKRLPLALLMLAAAPLAAQTPTPPKANDATTPLHLLQPAYPVPYGQVKASDV